jgi:hypothetical protein
MGLKMRAGSRYYNTPPSARDVRRTHLSMSKMKWNQNDIYYRKWWWCNYLSSSHYLFNRDICVKQNYMLYTRGYLHFLYNICITFIDSFETNQNRWYPKTCRLCSDICSECPGHISVIQLSWTGSVGSSVQGVADMTIENCGVLHVRSGLMWQGKAYWAKCRVLIRSRLPAKLTGYNSLHDLAGRLLSNLC